MKRLNLDDVKAAMGNAEYTCACTDGSAEAGRSVNERTVKFVVEGKKEEKDAKLAELKGILEAVGRQFVSVFGTDTEVFSIADGSTRYAGHDTVEIMLRVASVSVCGQDSFDAAVHGAGIWGTQGKVFRPVSVSGDVCMAASEDALEMFDLSGADEAFAGILKAAEETAGRKAGEKAVAVAEADSAAA